MDAILSIDTTKGNRVINLNGFALSPTIKEGYILEVSNDLMDVMTRVTGKLPAIFPVAQQDITPYGNDLHHLNSILQPATSTNADVYKRQVCNMKSRCLKQSQICIILNFLNRFTLQIHGDR